MRQNAANRTPSCDLPPSLAHRLAGGLVKLGSAVNRHARKTTGSRGLGLTQTRILEFLRQCPNRQVHIDCPKHQPGFTREHHPAWTTAEDRGPDRGRQRTDLRVKQAGTTIVVVKGTMAASLRVPFLGSETREGKE